MKRILSFIIIFIVFIIVYLLQSNFFNWFTIAGVKPNLFIILSLFLGLFLGKTYGTVLSILLGIILDLFISKIIGINLIALGLVSMLGGILSKNFSKGNKMTIMIMVAGSTLFFEVCAYLLQTAILKIDIQILAFVKIIIIEILYNVILTILLYPLIQRFGNWVEETFKKDKILTRYY